MNARAARPARGKGAEAKGHRHSNQLSREQLHRENERLLRENEELRRKVAERDRQIAEREKQIADADKQIADLERQLAGGKRTLPTPPNHPLQTDWPESRGRAAESTRASASRAPSPGTRGIIDPWFPRPK